MRQGLGCSMLGSLMNCASLSREYGNIAYRGYMKVLYSLPRTSKIITVFNMCGAQVNRVVVAHPAAKLQSHLSKSHT